MSFFKKAQANTQKITKQTRNTKTNTTDPRKKQIENTIRSLVKIINDLEQRKKKLPFYKSNEKKQLEKRIAAAKSQKQYWEKKLNETFAPSVISPCTFQIIKFVIAVLFLVLLIKLYSRLSVFSSINEFYTTRQDTKAFNQQ